MTMVLPTLKVSSGDVSSTRVRTGRGRSMLLVTSQVVDDGLQNLVDVAIGSEQAGTLQTLDHVVFRLLLPFALGGRGEASCAAGAFVLHAVDADRWSTRRPCRPSSGRSPRCGSAP